MRLDHLLSKENWSDEIVWSSVLRSVQSAGRFTLFNLEGTLRRVYGNGGLAQLGERLPCKQEVSGSIPLISTTYFLLKKKVSKENFKQKVFRENSITGRPKTGQ